jgi:hypothetical protein
MIPRDHYPMYNVEDLPTLQVFELQSELDFHRKRLVMLSITHKFGLLVHDRFDFVGDVERDVHGAWTRASRRSVSMSLCSLR